MKASKLRVGEILSETSYYEVVEKVGDKSLMKMDGTSSIVEISNSYVEKNLKSADQFYKEDKVTRTELIEIFRTHPRVAMTVNFNKKVSEKDVIEGLISTYNNLKVGTTEDELRKEIKGALTLKGEERTMRGRHYGFMDGTGRMQFIDMETDKKSDKDYDTRQRLVDPRTLNWLIVDGTKYLVK